MKPIKAFAWFGLALMSAAIIYGFLYGDFSGEGRMFLNLVWGRVTMIDLYLSFGVFIIWILYRESNWIWKTTWTLFILTSGSFAICLYLLVTLYRSHNNPRIFFMGHPKKHLNKVE